MICTQQTYNAYAWEDAVNILREHTPPAQHMTTDAKITYEENVGYSVVIITETATDDERPQCPRCGQRHTWKHLD